MSEREPEGHPVMVMAIGGFIGGMWAGGSNAGPWEIVILPLMLSFGALAAFGHINKETWRQSLVVLLGLSTTIPIPCGGVGFIVGKALWGVP